MRKMYRHYTFKLNSFIISKALSSNHVPETGLRVFFQDREKTEMKVMIFVRHE